MKIQNKTDNRERKILIGMIVDRVVLGRITSRWTGGMFKSSWANLIAHWCIDYFNKYEKAPLRHIQSIFEAWAEKNNDKDSVNIVEKFLESLSDEYKELKKESNSNYIIDIAGKYFNEVKLGRLAESIQGDIDRGKVESANSNVLSFNQIELGAGSGIDIFQDSEAIKTAFEDESEILIQYPGAVGEFFGNSLEREGFIAFLAPKKRGKTFWLYDCAYRAALQRKRTALFDAGDMGQKRMIIRFMTRIAGRPRFCKKPIKYPTKIYRDKESRTACVSIKEKIFKKDLSWRISIEACQEAMKEKIKSKEPYLRLSNHPNSTLSVRDIKGILKGWEREGWIPDVIIIDYADILKMTYQGIEGRDKINETWKELRSLSQQQHCLVITATQSDVDSYSTETMGPDNFSEDNRKAAHITGMIGINQTQEEKDNGIFRLNWIHLREDEFSTGRCVHTAGCLAICNPAIRSCY